MDIVGRKSFRTKASEAIKPESEKNTLEKIQEKRTNNLDKFAKQIQPESDKGTLQKGADKVSTYSEQPSYGDQANSYLEVAKEKVADAADYVSNSLRK